MVNRKVIRKHNSPVTTGIINRYDDGGSIWDINKLFTKENLGKLGLGLLGPAGNAANGLISNGLSSGAGNAVNKVGSTVGSAISTVNPLLGGIVSAGTGLIGGITNALFGSKINKENVNNVRNSNNALSTVKVDNSSNDSILNQWSNQDFGADFSQSDIGKDGLFSNKAKKLYKELKKEQEIARGRALLSYDNAIESASKMNDLRAMASFAAYGGPLGMWDGYGNGAIDYELAKENLSIKALNAANKGRLTSLPNSFESPELNTFAKGGKIHIKPSKRGTFTAAAKRHGKSVQSFASQVLANKEDYSPAMVKKANFARNASKWKHADGGPLKKGKYEDWYKTVPADRNDTTSYNLKRAYELAPYDELEAWRASSIKDLEEGKNHLRSVYLNPNTGVYEFMKSKNHPTLHFETDWYNSNDPEAVKFRKDYDLDMSGDYYKYVPKKKAFGGDLLTHGAEWDNGLKVIGNGGTHEENPMEGVPMGIAPDGQSNLVEEGEVIFNDYVFSNRMTADKDLLEAFNLPKSYDGYSFATIAERLGKESEERPNDPISRRGLMSSISRLQQAQETMRQKNQAGQEGIQYAHGGRMGILFDGLGDSPNVLDGGDTTDKSSRMTWLRYAPVVGAAIGLGQNLFSKPDYTSADTILEAANQVGNYTPVEYTPIGNYLQYRPFDRSFYLNKLNAQAGATRRAIMNTTSPSRNAALLAADYNALGRLGDLARQAEEYNLAQRQAVETFNRGTNMTNSEMGLKAAMTNQEAALRARSSRLSGVAQAMAMRDAIDNRRSASMSANLTNLFDSLGSIGKEEFTKDMIEKNPALLYDWMGKYRGLGDKSKEDDQAHFAESLESMKKASKKKSKGGYLTIKKRRK